MILVSRTLVNEFDSIDIEVAISNLVEIIFYKHVEKFQSYFCNFL